jgi:hypothetical protein
VLGEAPLDVLGDAGVERAVAAAEDVEVRHAGGIIGVEDAGAPCQGWIR